MIVLSVRELEQAAAGRPPGYLDDVLRAATRRQGDRLYVEPETYRSLQEKYGKKDGLGNFVSGALAAVGITPARVSRLLGRPCKCQQRVEALNRFGERVARAFQAKTGVDANTD